MELEVEEQVEPKAFQEQEQAEGALQEEGKEEHVDPEAGRQLEDLQVNWDTAENIYIKLCEKNPNVLYEHTKLG